MIYNLAFKTSALKEWRRLDHSVQALFKKKLAERLENPCVPSAKLAGSRHRYKIKLRQAGYRLVYEVDQGQLIVLVVAVGRREHNQVYLQADQRK